MKPPIIIICLLLVFIPLTFLLLSLTRTTETRETITAWQPAIKPGDSSSQNPTTFTTINETTALTRNEGYTIFGGAGGTKKTDPRHSYYSRGWSQGGQWWQLSQISTTGYEHIELSFSVKGSDTGPKNYIIEYSIDGEDWAPLKDSNNVPIAYSIDKDNRFHKHGPYALSSEAGDVDLLYFRFINSGIESVAGGEIKSTGTNYITDIVITGVTQLE